MTMLTLGSLFDGIGGWPLAAVHAGIVPVWSSEIEAFPQLVTARHFPKMKQLGDITKLDGTKIAPVDIITMGSPCQDLSIAGKRKGLNGERSGLFRTAIDIIQVMRRTTGKTYPRFVVWENVPGAFSSNKGNDFRAVLEEITESQIPMPESRRWAKAGMVRSNGCEVAWRTLDAQYWGVPQRRKRIFLVADFRGQCAVEILFKPESLPGDTAESGSRGQRTAGGAENNIISTGTRNRTLAAPTLNARMGTGGSQVPVMLEPYCIGNGQIHQSLSNKAGALNCMHDQQAVIVKSYDCKDLGRRNAEFMEKSPTLKARMGTGGGNVPLVTDYKVRRLTPLECERLQGLPDGWTAGGSDSERYTTLGNGMVQQCADFVIQRIAEIISGNGDDERA